MTKNELSPELFRVIDANLNRLKEGIRVIEDIMRYRDNNKKLSQQLKSLRHLAVIDEYTELLTYRDSINDVLRPTTKSEMKRSSIVGIMAANFKRAEESSRVLEELFKLYKPQYSENFKHIRYELYDLEKQIVLNEKQ
jgi:thiamine-phosphate pyrophosphorylase